MNDLTGKRAVIYTRVSRDDTGEGKSNARQEEDCRAFARLRGYEVVAVEEDVSVSAYSGRVRPGWQAVLGMIRSGEADVILAWKVDRITRTVRELSDIIATCREFEASVVTTDGDLDLSTPQGKAIATILGSIAEMEVERKGERQRSANAQRRAEGQPWRSGWASFGYTLDKEVIPEQAEMIRKAASDVLAGGSLKGVAREWKASGVSTPRSSKGADGWTHNGVKTILLNPVNAGINTYRGDELGPGDWEAIITEPTLRQLQALLSDPSRRTYAGTGRRAETLLSGLATCATCGRTVQAGVSNRRKVYKCSNPVGEHLTTDREQADQFVLDSLTRGGEVFKSHRILPDAARHEGTDDLVAEVTALDIRERAITERFTEGLIEEETWTRALVGIKEQRATLQERIDSTAGDARTASALARARIESFLSLSLHDKRLTMRAIVTIELHSRNRRRGRPISEQVTIWANPDRGRAFPLVAGTHPDTVARAEEIMLARDLETYERLGGFDRLGPF